MPVFPSYAQILMAGYGETRESALLRTEMEEGPPKQARIRSRVMVTRNATILLKTKADYQSFVTWFASTLVEGSLWFDFLDPVSNTTKQARFVGGGLEAATESGVNVWKIPAKIETWG